MAVKVVLKKRMVGTFVLFWSIAGATPTFVLIFEAFFPKHGLEFFYLPFYTIWFLLWCRLIRYALLRAIQLEINESGVTFLPVNGVLFPESKTFFWDDEIKVSHFLPLIELRIAQKKKILGFLNFPYYALIPTRDWIENIDEVDAFLETLPSNWLSELWRKP